MSELNRYVRNYFGSRYVRFLARRRLLHEQRRSTHSATVLLRALCTTASLAVVDDLTQDECGRTPSSLGRGGIRSDVTAVGPWL